MTYAAFISYSSQNRQEAEDLERRLSARRLKCFLAPKRIRGGEVFDERIRNGLLSSNVLCLLATKEALKSEWVMTEWGAAWALGKPLIPILLRCEYSDLPLRLRELQCIDFHDIDRLVQSIRAQGRTVGSGVTVVQNTTTACLGDADFLKQHANYLKRKEVSAVWLWSYTGETTNGMILGFMQMQLSITVRLLTRDWTQEARDELEFNQGHPGRPRDWDKARHIEAAARGFPAQPWAKAGGGHINFEQRFYGEPPINKAILYINRKNEPIAGFFGFYKLDPEMKLEHPSIYVDVGQPILKTEDSTLLGYIASEFADRWCKARTYDNLVSNGVRS